jgi:hypothetical protein
MDYQEEVKKKLDDEYKDSLKRFKKEYFELCFKQIKLEDELVRTMKRITILEALIAFYGELDKKGDKE